MLCGQQCTCMHLISLSPTSEIDNPIHAPRAEGGCCYLELTVDQQAGRHLSARQEQRSSGPQVQMFAESSRRSTDTHTPTRASSRMPRCTAVNHTINNNKMAFSWTASRNEIKNHPILSTVATDKSTVWRPGHVFLFIAMTFTALIRRVRRFSCAAL